MALLAAGSRASSGRNLIQGANWEENTSAQATTGIFRTALNTGAGNKCNFLSTGRERHFKSDIGAEMPPHRNKVVAELSGVGVEGLGEP